MILDTITQEDLFLFFDPTSESWVTVSQVEIRPNRYKISLSGPIGLKIWCELADL